MVIMKAALKQRTMGEQIPKIYLELERMVERKRVELAYLKKPPTVYFEEFRVMAMNIPKLEDEVDAHMKLPASRAPSSLRLTLGFPSPFAGGVDSCDGVLERVGFARVLPQGRPLRHCHPGPEVAHRSDGTL